MPKKTTSKDTKLITANEALFEKLFEVVLWPIIEPLILDLDAKKIPVLKEKIWLFFFLNLQDKDTQKVKKEIMKLISNEQQGHIKEFITGLVSDFTNTFFEEVLENKDKQIVIDAMNQLIDQQLILNWIENLVERTFSPLLLFSIENQSKISDIQIVITKVLLAIIQEKISIEEAVSQVTTYLQYNHNLKDEILIFVKSIIRTVAKFKQQYGLHELAKIAELQISANRRKPSLIDQDTIANITNDVVSDREKLVDEWVKSILEPACIALKIAGKESYYKFITKCKDNFELFLDQTLSAEDFEKRLDKELKTFGGEDEELIQPIRESIASSVRFLEVARIDDPSLSVLLMLIEDERETAKKSYL